MWKVAKDESGFSLLKFLGHKNLNEISLKKLKKMIDSGACLVNGRIEKFASFKIVHGDVVELKIFEEKKEAYFEKKRILYEDETLLFYDKPAGIVSDSFAWLKALNEYIPGLCLVHRLDKETSGVLLFAKSQTAKEQLIQQFQKKSVKKLYLALVDGLVKEKSGLIQNYLGKKKQWQGQALFGEVPSSKGLFAQTSWKQLALGVKCTLVACYPVTGRTHQLRVHLLGIGHPILGDDQYCRNFKCDMVPKRMLLHAFCLTILHPLTKKEVTVFSELPEDFNTYLKQAVCEFSLSKHLL